MGVDLCTMILAAGRGERMRPLTDQTPKPLIVVRGKPLIVHHIEKLVAIGVERIVINVSYRADDIVKALGNGARFGCELIYSHETEPLETGGGVATASAYFDKPRVILASADVYSDIDYQFFLDRAQTKMRLTENSWNAHFFLVAQSATRPGGEFALDASGCVTEGTPRHTLANVMMIRTELVQQWPRGVRFPLLPHYREWVSQRRVTGQLHTGRWCNVTTVSDVEMLNALP